MLCESQDSPNCLTVVNLNGSDVTDDKWAKNYICLLTYLLFFVRVSTYDSSCSRQTDTILRFGDHRKRLQLFSCKSWLGLFLISFYLHRSAPKIIRFLVYQGQACPFPLPFPLPPPDLPPPPHHYPPPLPPPYRLDRFPSPEKSLRLLFLPN